MFQNLSCGGGVCCAWEGRLVCNQPTCHRSH